MFLYPAQEDDAIGFTCKGRESPVVFVKNYYSSHVLIHFTITNFLYHTKNFCSGFCRFSTIYFPNFTSSPLPASCKISSTDFHYSERGNASKTLCSILERKKKRNNTHCTDEDIWTYVYNEMRFFVCLSHECLSVNLNNTLMSNLYTLTLLTIL